MTREERSGRRLDLSVPQVAGSALAAVAAAVLASRLGVYGTIIGAGVVSIVATCGGSVFQHLFSRTGDQLRGATTRPRRPSRRVRSAVPAGSDGGSGDGGDGEFGAPTTHGTRVRGWKRPTVAAAVVFGVAMTGITGYEMLSGSGLDGGNGTTVGSVVRGGQGDGSAPKEAPSAPPADERDRQQTEKGEEAEEAEKGGQEKEPAPDGSRTDEPTKPAPDPKESSKPSTAPDPADPADPSRPASPPAQPSPPADGKPGTEGGTSTPGAKTGAGAGSGGS
ncbi:hypothetical protein [Streptomyces sp. NPDC047315]|uniref:hypothetical protein n=1 Tax=Streptomyces sp. NPDC047315 TaxID=3155142 RepID=UPI0033F96440